jgi:nicotinate phosphoribosyltransferase
MKPTLHRTPSPPALLLDLYELTMAQSYLDHGVHGEATFSLFARRLPKGWGFFLAAGLQDVLHYLQTLRFGPSELDYLETTGVFRPSLLEALERFRFSGTVRALPEGTVCFPQEPLLEVTAPLLEAQLVETAVLNLVHFQTLVASKAARCVLAAGGRRLVDFGARRCHGAEAAAQVARCAYLAGFDSTSNLLAGQRYGIPVAGTMAHSYVECWPEEVEAFRRFAASYPDDCVLLVDTYDTRRGCERAATVGRELAASGHRLRGVRLDSGDLADLSADARATLDRAGLADATVFASGSLDEHVIARLVEQGAPIDGFGVGTRLGVVADAPYLDMAYKLVEYDGQPVMKLSEGKVTWPGRKQVWRRLASSGIPDDLLGLADEHAPARMHGLLHIALANGAHPAYETLERSRARAADELARLPALLRDLSYAHPVPVRVSDRLVALRQCLSAEVGQPVPAPVAG